MSDGDIGMLTETLNEVLERCEKAFRAARWGVVAAVPLDEGWMLSFRKAPTGQKRMMWQLYVHSTLDPFLKMPLLSASRIVRMSAARNMPALYATLQEEVRCQEQGLRAVINDLEAFVETLEASKD